MIRLLAFLSLAISSYAATLAWNPSPGATGYKLYYGPSPAIYTNEVNVASPSVSVALVPGATYFFSVTAYNQAGESAYSTEISYTAPLPARTLIIESSATVLGPWLSITQLVVKASSPQFWRLRIE